MKNLASGARPSRPHAAAKTEASFAMTARLSFPFTQSVPRIASFSAGPAR